VPKDVKEIFDRHPEARPAGIGKDFVVASLNTRDLRTAQARR